MNDRSPEKRNVTDQEVQRVVDHVTSHLGDRDRWPTPDGYPNSLALCIIDAIQSIGVHYGSVVNVIQRYKDHRGGDRRANTDGATDLLATFNDLGDPISWAREIGNRQRTSTEGGILKAEAIQQAAQALLSLNPPINSTAELRAAVQEQRTQTAKAAWTAIRGQRSGISWRYLLMNAGVEEVKPDRMLQRFVAASLNQPHVPNDQVAALVTAAATKFRVSPRTLDHTIWLYESARARGRKS